MDIYVVRVKGWLSMGSCENRKDFITTYWKQLRHLSPPEPPVQSLKSQSHLRTVSAGSDPGFLLAMGHQHFVV
jgi:hypothetical protein